MNEHILHAIVADRSVACQNTVYAVWINRAHPGRIETSGSSTAAPAHQYACAPYTGAHRSKIAQVIIIVKGDQLLSLDPDFIFFFSSRRQHW